MDIEEVTVVTDDVVDALARLMPQLSPAYRGPSRGEIEHVIDRPGSVLLVARDPHRRGAIVGSLTLVVFRVPSGVRAWIEDVVVDAGWRNHGIGEMLSRVALARAAEMGARSVDLTSRPTRVAANRLYRRLGFAPRETSLLRYRIA
jgi:ribosomal protein S18 acetylase RimI-like enzyme